jgi:hypothetical protein
VQLDKCTAEANKLKSVQVGRGATAHIAGCVLADNVEMSGLAAVGKGTLVEVKASTCRGHHVHDVHVKAEDIVQLEQCAFCNIQGPPVFHEE